MTESQTRVLVPSFAHAFVRVFSAALVIIPVGTVIQRWQSGHWWSFSYCLSLALPFALFSLAVCLAFVPRRIEWSEAGFLIHTRSRTGAFSWDQLYAYSGSERAGGLFVLQFTGTATFKIYPGAFEPAQLSALREFLVATYPTKRARFWVGPFAIRRSA